jgi:tRNA1Val (adenine37-N6)-methyltransferase
MKVNTDGVLLGAWADVAHAGTILDIGTGTGVIALMMGQRNQAAMIDAIDIDEDAYIQAKENFAQSPWTNRLKVFHTSLQDFHPDKKYDLIISNPPYFIDDFKTEDKQKNIAKHSISLSYQELISGISRLLTDTGEASLVLPVFNLSLLQSLAKEQGLFINTITEVTAVSGKAPYLTLIKLSKSDILPERRQLTIQTPDGYFTAEYRALTQDFYLKF